MADRVLALLGTKKGAFIAESDRARSKWELHGPFCEQWPITHVAFDPATGAIVAGGGNAWYGPAVWRSTDAGGTWTHSSAGLTYGEGVDPVVNVWALRPAHGVLYAGVEPMGLFRSDDRGLTWSGYPALQDHPTKDRWSPGNGGFCLHSIVVHPDDPRQIWIGFSVGGVYHTADGGQTWEPRNRNVRAPGPDPYPDVGQCCHHLEMAAGDPDTLYQQNHMGMYVSRNAGEDWTELTEGLPSTFGFPAAVHPRKSGTWYLAPLNGDSLGRYMPGAAAAIYRSEDAGTSWRALRTGLPQEGAYFGVFRQALATDTLDPAGVYFGTNTGHVFASADEGERWQEIASYLPPVYSVETAVI